MARKSSEATLNLKYLTAVEAIIEGLAGSDFVAMCGSNAIREMSLYKLDMAQTLADSLENRGMQAMPEGQHVMRIKSSDI